MSSYNFSESVNFQFALWMIFRFIAELIGFVWCVGKAILIALPEIAKVVAIALLVCGVALILINVWYLIPVAFIATAVA